MDEGTFLQTAPLFRGMTRDEIDAILRCLGAVRRTYPKGAFVRRRDEELHSLGIVLSGRVHILEEDFWGNRTILGEASAGQLFGESYACLPEEPLRADVQAMEDTAVLYLKVDRISRPCGNACAFHSRLLENLLAVLAEKNKMLTRKMEHLSRRTTREKVLSYLSDQSRTVGSAEFLIPFDRQQLADYLGVDRSALSAELGKLRRQGVLETQKNRFRLLELPNGWLKNAKFDAKT